MGHYSPVFYIVVALVLLGVAYAVYRFRTNQKAPETQTLGLNPNVPPSRPKTDDKTSGCFVETARDAKNMMKFGDDPWISAEQQEHLRNCDSCQELFREAVRSL